jgi:hypothetical protein
VPRFKSRLQGLNAAKRHWVCRACGTAFTVKKPTTCTHCPKGEGKDFHYFASLKEYRRYNELLLMEKAGLLDKGTIELHPRYLVQLGGGDTKNVYLDFRYKVHGREVIEDCKSWSSNTDVSKLNRRLAEGQHNIEVILV